MKYYKLNEPNITAEIIDNEVLMVNLLTGRYYSLRNTSVTFWRLLSDGHSLESAIENVSKAYSIDVAIVKKDFAAFISELLANELIIEVSNVEAKNNSEWMEKLSGNYSPALIEQYTDMEDLVLLS